MNQDQADKESAEEPDGKRSDILEQALADKEAFEEDQAVTDPNALPIFLMGVSEEDGVNSSVGSVTIEQDGDGLSAIVLFSDYEAAGKLQTILDANKLNAVSFLVEPDTVEGETMLTLQDEITTALNQYSAENDSGTPDFILAEYLLACLEAYNTAINSRANWRGRPLDRFGYEAGTNDLFPDIAADGSIELQGETPRMTIIDELGGTPISDIPHTDTTISEENN